MLPKFIHKFFILLTNPIKRPKPTMNWSHQQVLCVYQSLIVPLCHRAPSIKNTSVSHTVSLADMFLHYHKWTHTHTHTHTVDYLDLIPHTLSCCHKYSLEHQIWINPPLKIVPNKFTPIWVTFAKNYSDQLFHHYNFLSYGTLQYVQYHGHQWTLWINHI